MLRIMRMYVWNSMRVRISYRSFWQKWNFISGDRISCKRYPKLNVYTCPLNYRVVLKCSQNETTCEQNLFSRRFEISNRYEFISPLMWTYSKARTFLLEAKEMPGTRLIINTVCNFQTMNGAVELNRVLLKFLILCHVDIQKISREDKQK